MVDLTPSPILFPMSEHVLIWNVCGLNNRARRCIVRDILIQQHASILCLQETKVKNFSVNMLNELMGTDFNYCCLPASSASGGILVAWRRDLWTGTCISARRFSVSVPLQSLRASTRQPWWLTLVYGPSTRDNKPAFLSELSKVWASCPGLWMVCGDFNLIYQAEDKNNDRLHRGLC